MERELALLVLINISSFFGCLLLLRYCEQLRQPTTSLLQKYKLVCSLQKLTFLNKSDVRVPHASEVRIALSKSELSFQHESKYVATWANPKFILRFGNETRAFTPICNEWITHVGSRRVIEKKQIAPTGFNFSYISWWVKVWRRMFLGPANRIINNKFKLLFKFFIISGFCNSCDKSFFLTSCCHTWKYTFMKTKYDLWTLESMSNYLIGCSFCCAPKISRVN